MFYRIVSAYTRHFSFPYRGLKYFLRLAKWLNIADKTYKKKVPGNFYMLLNPTEHIQQQLFWYGYYEKEVLNLIERVLKPGDVFLDIGANIGYFSLLAASRESKCKVIAFEPAGNIYEQLRANISLNHLTNITTLNAAAGEKSEEKELFLSSADNLGMSSLKQPGNFSGKTEMVKVVAIDDWLKNSGLTKIDLVKIDVEGGELAVLKGMKETLSKLKPLLIIEINPETLAMFNLKAADLFKYLDEMNFGAFEFSVDSGLLQHHQGDVTQTRNYVFIHPDKYEGYNKLLYK